MPIRYWLFISLTLCLVGFVGYGVFMTNRLLRTWQPDRNLLLIPSENGLRLVLIGVCLLLGLISGLSRAQLGWVFANVNHQLLLGGLWGGGLALFFYATTRWVMRQSGERFYSTVIIKAVVPHNQQEFFLVSLAMLSVVALEELLFRSLLLGGLTPVLPGFLLVLVGGLLFGLMHVPQGIWGMIGAAGAGMLLGWLFLWEGSLLAPLVAHYIANLVQVCLAMRLRLT
ncbi:MAG: CPBP family intramembrane glutamic endopeptidase [Caldilineaceae bacterium]